MQHIVINHAIFCSRQNLLLTFGSHKNNNAV